VRNAGKLFQATYGAPAAQIEAAYRKHSGIPRRALFAAICAEAGLQPPDEARFRELSARFSELNLAALSGPTVPGLVPSDTLSALEALSSLGGIHDRLLYISSSADTDELRSIAAALGLAGYFAGIFGSQPGFTKGKEHIARVLQERGGSLEQVVFVGDEPADLAIGREAGVRTILKAGTYPAEALRQLGAVEVINSLNELLPLLVGSSRQLSGE
jgi:phosphoglycolate phosphatase-like HAD superfamily hydrolase